MILASTCEAAATWLTAIGTVGAVVVALGLGLWAWRRQDRRRPRLALGLSPDNTRVEEIHDGLPRKNFAVYVRLEVSNPLGKDAAEETQLLLVSHSSTHPSPQAPVFLGHAPLGWTHSLAEPTRMTVPSGSSRFVDLGLAPQLGSQRLPQNSFAFAVHPEPLDRRHVVGPGTYSIRLELVARNADATSYQLVLEVRDEWDATDTSRRVGARDLERVVSHAQPRGPRKVRFSSIARRA